MEAVVKTLVAAGEDMKAFNAAQDARIAILSNQEYSMARKLSYLEKQAARQAAAARIVAVPLPDLVAMLQREPK